jgi:enoyl-CoA hydratase/carnithine racemase
MDAFVSVVGMRTADLHLQLGTLFSAEEALDVGLVDELAKDEDEAREKALAMIKRLVSAPSMRSHLQPYFSKPRLH